MGRRLKTREKLTSPMFPIPGQNIKGDWRVCEIDEKGAIKKIGKDYLTRDLAYDAANRMSNGYYIVKFLRV
jgi:hypothetical protein